MGLLSDKTAGMTALEAGRISVLNGATPGGLTTGTEYKIFSKLVKIDFSGTHTYLTRFEDANLKYVTQISQLQLEIACGNEATQLPEGLARPASWPCEE